MSLTSNIQPKSFLYCVLEILEGRIQLLREN
jgi:hypothetical protein